MKFILVTDTGNAMIFSIQACADIYKTIYGGKITKVQQ